MSLKGLDLFCGAGGFSTGFIKAGFEVKYGIDNDLKVKETFEYNHPNTEFILSNIEELDPNDFKDIDIIIGSPPCQQFSNANNNPDPNLGMELVNEFIKWVKILKPKFWIMENVPGVMKFLKWRIKDFRMPRIKILNCANYGVPQTRKRCFAGRYKIPKRTHSKYPYNYDIFGEKIKKWVTVYEAIGDIMFLNPHQKIIIERSEKFAKKYKCKLNKVSNQVTTKDDCLLLSNHQNYNSSQKAMEKQRNSKNSIARNKFLSMDKPSNTVICNEKDQGPIIKNHQLEICNSWSLNNKGNHPNNQLDEPNQCLTKSPPPIIQKYTDAINNKEYNIDKPSKNIRQIPFKWLDGKPLAQKANNQAKFNKYRRLTVRECARLQSFPDDFIFFGSLSAQYKMVGNAVPVLMAKRLAEAIKKKFE